MGALLRSTFLCCHVLGVIARGEPHFVGWDTLSPDGDALGGVQPHLVAGGDVERLGESVKVAQYLVAAELSGRVGVDRQHLACELGTCGRAPCACPRVEEALRTRDSVDDGGGVRGQPLLGERGRPGLPRDGQAAEVADVLTDRERAVDVGERAFAALL